ncbi:MAG: hypothetical protein QOJ87_2540, partial [Verrucomicrobiota bacterium]
MPASRGVTPSELSLWRFVRRQELVEIVNLYQRVTGRVLKASHDRGVASGRDRPGPTIPGEASGDLPAV